MQLEKQVVSLELAKILKELGVEQKSLFWWASMMRGDEEESVLVNVETLTRMYKGEYGWVWLSAFTVAELGEMLPWDIVIHRDINKGWHITFQANGLAEKDILFSEDSTEADARAKMLIYLLEQGLIKDSKK